MPGIEPNDLQPGENSAARATSARPSLVASQFADTAAAGDERPIRMLDALQRGGAASPRHPGVRLGGTGLWPWALAALGLVAVPAIVVALMTTGSAGVDPAPSAAAVASARVDDKGTAPPEAASAPAPTPAVAPASDAAGPAGADALTGPAKVEVPPDGLATLPGMEAAIAAQRARAAQPATTPSAAVGVVAEAQSGPVAARAVAAANRTSAPVRAAKRTAHTSTSARAHAVTRAVASGKPTASAPAATAGHPASDPDAELVAAIMARLESRGAAAPTGRAPDRSNTIATLVRDCQALPEPAHALACRRRICDGYWGKAQACPKSLAPSAKARTAAAAAGDESVSR